MVKTKESKSPLGLIFCKYPAQYEIFDFRANKPICFQKAEKEEIKGSMVFQEMDEVVFNKRKDIKIEYFTPNNISLLLSISAKASAEAKFIYEKDLDPYRENKTELLNDNKKRIIDRSTLVYNYLEKIEISIVFGYTAVESFANISIPKNYEHKFRDSKGIVHNYDKEAIERWLTLREKVATILTSIFRTPKIETQKFWNNFLRLEEYRNNIIHQKSISRTDFYKSYFKRNIEKVCESSFNLLEFFYKKQENKNSTHGMWPWLVNPRKEFPIDTNFDSEKIEIIGNIYEGYSKKRKSKPKRR